MYYARKQNDGTYIIYETGRRDPVLTGVRGCNVQRTISKLYDEALIEEAKWYGKE